MFKSLFLVVVIGVFFFSCNEGDRNDDIVLKTNELTEELLQSAPDSVYQQLQDLRVTMSDLEREFPDSLIAKNYYFLGLYHKNQSNRDSAIFYLQKACELVGESITTDQQKDYFQQLHTLHLRNGQYGICKDISNQFRSLLDPEKDFDWMATSYYFDVTVYRYSGDWEKAAQSNAARLEMLRLSDNTDNIIDALVVKAEMLWRWKRDLKGVFKIFDEIFISIDSVKDEYKGRVYGDFGIYQYYNNDLNKAIENYSNAVQYFKRTKSSGKRRTDNLATQYCNIAEAYMDLNKYQLAENYLDSVKQIGLLKIDKSYLRFYWKLKLELSTQNGGQLETSRNLDTLFSLYDQQLIQDTQDQLDIVNKAYKDEKALIEEKQQAELSLVRQKSYLIIGGVSVVLLVLILLLYFRNRKSSFEKEILLTQQRLFRSQMNPHFTFNVLYAIQTELRKDPASAGKYLTKFSRLLRLILENSLSNYVPVGDELESMRKYMDLQLIRFPGKFDYDMVLKNLDEEDPVYIPPMLMQPIIENSIEHGFSNISSKGLIKINLEKSGELIFCEIEDNGQGLQSAESKHKTSTSSGLVSNFLSKTFKRKITIINKADFNYATTGLLTRFQIPFKITPND